MTMNLQHPFKLFKNNWLVATFVSQAAAVAAFHAAKKQWSNAVLLKDGQTFMQ